MTLYQFFFRFRFCIFFKTVKSCFVGKKYIKQEQHFNFWSDWTWTYCEVAYITFCMKNRGVSTIHFCFQPVMVVNLCQNTRLHFWDYDQQLLTGYCALCICIGTVVEKCSLWVRSLRKFQTQKGAGLVNQLTIHMSKLPKLSLPLQCPSPSVTQLMYLEWSPNLAFLIQEMYDQLNFLFNEKIL